MIALSNGMLLYHGSYTAVERIDLAKCRAGKDFGKGFYLTGDYEQARSFIPTSMKKILMEGYPVSNPSVGYVSVFRVCDISALRTFCFQDADREWLHFVAYNRKTILFPEYADTYKTYQVIGGKIANDQTARTLQLYVSGAFGEPGSKEADAFAIQQLLPNRLGDQYCFRDDAAVRQLVFIGSDPIEIGR